VEHRRVELLTSTMPL